MKSSPQPKKQDRSHPMRPKAPGEKLVWDSFKQGTYVKKKHGELK